MIPFQPIVLAISNRMRGGLISISSGQLGRLFFWGIPLTLCIFAVKQFERVEINYVYFMCLLGASFAGSCWANWGAYFNLTNPGDFKNLTIEGAKFVAPAALVAGFCSIWLGLAVLLGGLSLSSCYWVAWKIPSTIKGFDRGTPLGELFTGFSIGLFIYLASLING